jgi:hypothetical protein
MRLILIILFALGGLIPASARASDEMLAVIVPLQYAGPLPSVQELALIFKRKKLFWDDGTLIHPVNLPADNHLRRQFSQNILKSLPEHQMQYWNAMYYHGVFPPYVADSPEGALRFVAETNGAIGYVPACIADARVKSILWIGASGIATSTPTELGCPNE